MAGGPHHRFGAAESGEPDGRVWFLHGEDPGVDLPVVVILALVAEGARLRPALNDQVVGFLEAVTVLWRSDAALQGLHGSAAHEAGYDPPAGDAVQHGDFFGHADGVVDGNHVAQDGDLGVAGDFRDNCGVDVDGRFHAPVRGVVLVGHDAVKAVLVSAGVLLVVLVVEHVGPLGIEV